MLLMICIIFVLLVMLYSCKKESKLPRLHYYEVGLDVTAADWRDTSFIIATRNPALVAQIAAQLQLPKPQRKIVNGALLPGNNGYNKNSTHSFNWHFNETDWQLADVSAEIFDGRPYSDLHADTDYWLDTVKRFAPWGSYIKREITE